MKESRRRKGNDQGFVLLTVLVFTLILIVSALAYFQLEELDTARFHTDERYVQAYYAAEAGRERLAWILKKAAEIRSNPSNPCSPCEVNPFHPAWYPYPYPPFDPNRTKLANLLALANPVEGEPFFPAGERNAPYYRIVDVWGEGSRVYFRILGSVDTDEDGLSGLGTRYGNGYDWKNRDAEDINRYYEGYLSLPGSLGQDLSAGAKSFLDESQAALLTEESGPFITDRGETLSGFRYHESEPWGTLWRRYRYVFSKPILRGNAGPDDLRGEVVLPRGMFDPETGDLIVSYFADLVMKSYEGNQVFGRTTDPTSDIPASRKAILLVYGDVTLEGVRFGYLTGEGTLSGNDWAHTDIVVIATGGITLNGVDCGMVGRLTLVAKHITIKGSWGEVVNGIAVASGNLSLKSSQTDDAKRWVYRMNAPQPTYWSAYFYGTMVAGKTIQLDEGGWTVLFNRNVLNGTMYQKDTFSDNFEDGSFNSTGSWQDTWAGSPDSVFFFRQGRYLASEISSRQGDSALPGSDGVPQLMRCSSEPDLSNRNQHKTGVGQSLQYDLRVTSPLGQPVDWRGYRRIQFHMSLDNWKKRTNGRTTEKAAHFLMELKDSKVDGSSTQIQFSLTRPMEIPEDPAWQRKRYLEENWGTASYRYDDFLHGDIQEPAVGSVYPQWKWISLDFSDFRENPSNPAQVSNFDFGRVREFSFRMVGFQLRWPVQDGGLVKYESVEFNSGALQYRDKDNRVHGIWSNPTGEIQYLNPLTGKDDHVRWNPDPGVLTSPQRLKAEDLRSTLRIDKVVLPGSHHCNYGLPPCFRYEVSGWRELSEKEAMK